MKRAAVIGLSLVLLTLSLPVPRPLMAAHPSDVGPNSVRNSGFETGEILPDHWLPDMWNSSIDMRWDTTTARTGQRSARISATVANDARWMQAVSVQPHTLYRLSGWIKTQDVVHSKDGYDAGANLSVYGTYRHSTPLFGTNGWTHVSFTFDSGDSSRLIVAARLGYCVL